MEALLVVFRQTLNMRGSRQAHTFVSLQRLGNVYGIGLREVCGQCRAVLDGLSCSLSHERQHSVTGISQKRDAANGPPRHRRTVEERPYESLVDGAENFAHLWMPAFES